MDYRHTEDYARLKEAAGLRAEGLRREAIEQFWGAAARWVRTLRRAVFARRVI